MDAVLQRVAIKAERGAEAASFKLMELSLPLVPRDTDSLFHSAVVAKQGVGFGVVYHVGYGLREITGQVIFGPGVAYARWSGIYSPGEEKFVTRVPANYAWHQHFDTHISHPNGGQAYYLTQPIHTNLQELRAALHDGLRRGP